MPPLLVLPVFVMTKVTIFVPNECAAGLKVSVPFVATDGNTVKATLVMLLVAVVVTKPHFSLIWLGGPASIELRKLVAVRVTLVVSSLTNIRLVTSA